MGTHKARPSYQTALSQWLRPEEIACYEKIDNTWMNVSKNISTRINKPGRLKGTEDTRMASPGDRVLLACLHDCNKVFFHHDHRVSPNARGFHFIFSFLSLPDDHGVYSADSFNVDSMGMALVDLASKDPLEHEAQSELRKE